MRSGEIDRRTAQRHVAIDLGQHATRPERDDGANQRIAPIADDRLANTLGHGLGNEPGDGAAVPRGHIGGGGGQSSGIGDVEHDQAGLGLVRDRRRNRLERHGVSERRRGSGINGLRAIGDAEGCEHGAGGGFIARGQQCGGGAHIARVGAGGRRLPVEIAAHGIRAGLGRAEGGDTRLGQQFQRGSGLRQQESGDRVPSGGRQRAGDGILWAELGRRADHGDGKIGVIGVARLGERRGHRILAGAGQRGVHHPSGGNAEHAEPVHHHRPAAARGRDDTHGALRRHRRPRADQQRRQFEQRLQHIDADNPEIAKKRVRRRVGAGHGAGMGGRQRCPLLGPAELVSDDRLARRMRPPGSALEVLGRADGLEEQQDRVRLRIIHQQIRHLAGGEIGLVAGADDFCEAEAPRGRTGQQSAHHRAGLRHQGQPPGRQRLGRQRGVDRTGHGRRRVDHPHGIRPQQPHAAGLCSLHDAALQRLPLRPGFREPISQHAGHGNPERRTIGHGLFDMLGTDQDIGEVDLAGDVPHRGEGLFAQHLGGARVHREQLTGEAMLAEIDLGARGEAAGVGRGADQGDAAGGEEGGCEGHVAASTTRGDARKSVSYGHHCQIPHSVQHRPLGKPLGAFG